MLKIPIKESEHRAHQEREGSSTGRSRAPPGPCVYPGRGCSSFQWGGVSRELAPRPRPIGSLPRTPRCVLRRFLELKARFCPRALPPVCKPRKLISFITLLFLLLAVLVLLCSLMLPLCHIRSPRSSVHNTFGSCSLHANSSSYGRSPILVFQN